MLPALFEEMPNQIFFVEDANAEMKCLRPPNSKGNCLLYEVTRVFSGSLPLAICFVLWRNGLDSHLLRYREGLLLYIFNVLLIRTLFGFFSRDFLLERFRYSVEGAGAVPILRLCICRVSGYRIFSSGYSKKSLRMGPRLHRKLFYRWSFPVNRTTGGVSAACCRFARRVVILGVFVPDMLLIIY